MLACESETPLENGVKVKLGMVAYGYLANPEKQKSIGSDSIDFALLEACLFSIAGSRFRLGSAIQLTFYFFFKPIVAEYPAFVSALSDFF